MISKIKEYAKQITADANVKVNIINNVSPNLLKIDNIDITKRTADKIKIAVVNIYFFCLLCNLLCKKCTIIINKATNTKNKKVKPYYFDK